MAIATEGKGLADFMRPFLVGRDPFNVEGIVQVLRTATYIGLRHPDPKDDISLVEAVRRAVGAEMDLMVDANQGWLVQAMGPVPRWDLKRALYTARALQELGVRWLEEPLEKNNCEGYRTLRRSVALPIAGGEMNADLHEFRELTAGGSPLFHAKI